MKFIDKNSKLELLKKLIKNESTGNVEDISRRICVSRSTLLRYIDDLRLMGFNISFCFQRNTYYFLRKKDDEEKNATN